MAHAILMPKPGQMTEECTVVSWHKKEGDPVKRGDVLFEIETDKSTMEVEAFDDGVLLRIVAAEGAVVPVNNVCAYVGEPGEAIPEAASAAPTVPALTAPAPLAVPARSPTPAAAPVPATSARASVQASEGRIRISPRASRAAAEAGIDPRTATGSGPGGRITERDILAASRGGAGRDGRSGRPARGAAPRERSARDPPRRRGGGAATAQPDAPGDRRSPDPQLDVDAALHGDRRRGRDRAARAARGAEGRRHEPDGHGLRPGCHRPDPGRVPGRQLPHGRPLGLAAPAGAPRRRRGAPGRPRGAGHP